MKTIVSVLLLTFLVSCNRGESRLVNFVCSNKLVFIEDRDGEGGLYSFSFGDIMALDLETFEKVALTEDRFYDMSPTIRGDSCLVYFESKRSFKKYPLGLSAPSAIYSLDISRHSVQEMDFDVQGEFSSYLSGFKGTFRSPAVSSYGKTIAFIVDGKLGTDVLVICDLFSLRIRNVLDGLSDVRDLSWSRDGDHILFSVSNGKDMNDHSRGIRVVAVEDLTTLVNLKREGWFLQPGDMKDGEVVYVGYDLKRSDAPEFVYIFKVSKSDQDSVFSSPIMSISYPVFGDNNNVYFVAVAERTRSQKTDIYELGLETGEVKKLTSDGHQKACLRFVPDNRE